MRVREGVIFFDGAPEGWIAVGVLDIHHCFGIVRCVIFAISAVTNHSYRDVRVTVPCVEDVNIFSRSGSFFIDVHCQKVDFSGVEVLVQQIHRHRIIDVVTDVGLHYDVQDIP